MPENLLCPKQKASTPAFREGWDRVFGETLYHHKSMKDRLVVSKGAISEVNWIKEEPVVKSTREGWRKIV